MYTALPTVPDDAVPSPRPLPDLVGGRYKIVSRIGVGGMGIVYKAIDTQLNRAVAIKALEDRRLLLPGSAGRLRTEALAAASLDHPYICKIYELVETPLETFMVMEFVEGETLASMMKRGVLPLLQTLQIGREIAEGLAEAHAHGLVHRDVKPANVMITASGHVKLLDFGVAGADVSSNPGDRTRTLTPQLTVHAGTPQYMAPEQAAGEPVTARADLFALGVLLYECLTGSLPFSGTTTFDYVRNMMQSAPRRLDRIAPETPADLVDLIERCLEKTPADRPGSADVIVAELRRLASALTSPEASLRTARQARSGRRWMVLASVALALAAVAVGWRIFWPRASTDAPPRQSRPFVTSAAEESGSRVSPDGQWVSFISTSGGASQLMVQRVDGGEARPLTLGPGTPVSHTWSPDGTQVGCVFQLNNGWVFQVYPAFFGGAPQQTLSLEDADAGAKDGPKVQRVKVLRWIDRTIYLQVTQQDLSLRRVELDGATGMTNISSNWELAGTLRSVDVSPDGRKAAMVLSVAGREDLWMANIDGSSLRALTGDGFFERAPVWNGRSDRIMFQSNRGGQMDLWEIDPRSQTVAQLASGEMEMIAESSSADGSLISFQRLSHNAKLWLWGPADPAGRQLTQDTLSDYSPAAPANGLSLAFQRSQPVPSHGYTIIDAKLFVAPFDGRATVGNAQPVADGFAPAFSADGTWIAYLQRTEGSLLMTVLVRNLSSGATFTVSKTAALPLLTLVPVDWSSTTVAWSSSGSDADLYFIDQPDVAAIRRYRAGSASADTPVIRSQSATEYFRDLSVSPDKHRLMYLSASKGVVNVNLLDLPDGPHRQIATFKTLMGDVSGRGWLDGNLVLLRRVQARENLGSDVEILVVNSVSGQVSRAGAINAAFMGTARLHAAKRALYITRIENGVHNVFEFAIDTGALRAVTRNTLSGVTFSGFHPIGASALVGTREERRQDIWLIQETGTKRPGNPAGR